MKVSNESSVPDRPTPVGCDVPVSGLITHAVTTEPWVGITYDEPLGGSTRDILRTFAEHGMTGTFFTLGEEAEASPELARAILSEGHELGNHAHNHRRLTKIPDHGHRQYGKALRAIESVTGFRTALARPPFGSVDDDVIAAAGALGMTTVKWGRTSAPRVISPHRIADAVLAGLEPGQIVLLHQKRPAARALPLILGGLRERGLRSVPVTRLLGGEFRY